MEVFFCKALRGTGLQAPQREPKWYRKLDPVF